MMAFHIIDHAILIGRLENWIGMTGSALDWFKSYPNSRTFSVSVGKFSFSSAEINCPVSQGSILELDCFPFIQYVTSSSVYS